MGSTDAVLYAEQGSHQLDIPSAVPLPSVNVMLKSLHEIFVATDRLRLSSVGCKINSEHVANGMETYDATLAISLQCNLFLFIMHPNRALARGCAACHWQALGMFEYCNSMTPYQQAKYLQLLLVNTNINDSCVFSQTKDASQQCRPLNLG